jgi:hypothetical protein
MVRRQSNGLILRTSLASDQPDKKTTLTKAKLKTPSKDPEVPRCDVPEDVGLQSCPYWTNYLGPARDAVAIPTKSATKSPVLSLPLIPAPAWLSRKLSRMLWFRLFKIGQANGKDDAGTEG